VNASASNGNVSGLSAPAAPPTALAGRARARRRCFVYAVCGDLHAERVNVSLKFLKRYSSENIVILKSRTNVSIQHDQVLDVPIDARFDDHKASIALKTGLHKIFGDPEIVRCYLDSDLIAVKRNVDSVFELLVGKVAFANDHSEISEFSRRAVNCGCRSRRCGHLQQAVRQTFGVTIDRPNWNHWNGGLFVFDEASIPLLNRWHEFSLRILDDAYWRTRDQGTLAAAVWDQALQDDPVLPRSFNTIVDCFRGIPEQLRPTAPVRSYAVDASYSLKPESAAGPAFLHFINGGVMRRGWKNWDEAEDLLDPGSRTTLDALNGTHENREPGVAVPARDGELGLAALPLIASASRHPVSPTFPLKRHINILVPSLTLGGAERSVVETLLGLAEATTTASLFVSHEATPAYAIESTPSRRVRVLHKLELAGKMKTVALEVLASPCPVLFTHMVKAAHLRMLWDLGVATIPVIQNAQPSWQDPPEAFDHPCVPFVIAVSEFVARQLRDCGCPRRVVTVRHELQRWFSLGKMQANRCQIRQQYGIPDDTLLIGMVGQFKTQKAYTRAVRVLAEIRREHPAKLMILGGWDQEWGHGRMAYTAACRQALELDVMADLLTPGRVCDVEPYYAAFDVFLNTSIFEGLSVATLEAVQAGCPIVTADAGGNAEALPPQAVVVNDSANIAAYVSGIETALARGFRSVPERPDDAALVPRLWCLLGQHGLPKSGDGPGGGTGVLFLTDNLNVGGAPRSLVNLVCALEGEGTVRPWLGVMSKSNHQAHLDDLTAAGVRVFGLEATETYLDRAERCLQMTARLGVQTVVFWNLDARIKLLLAKVLPRGGVRLVDVSPGPLLFDELDNSSSFQRRLAFTSAQYLERLDRFVSKFADRAPVARGLDPAKLVVIPNGVPAPDRLCAHQPHGVLPPGADADLVLGTCCRIVPDKRVDFLVDMMAHLNARLPGANLVLVGGIHPKHTQYWETLQSYIRSRGVSNIWFVGHQERVQPYLEQFRVFVMISDRQGCPNASLEAMALGLPIVANPNGGTSEQVEQGVNGFLVSDEDPAEMAQRVDMLLRDPETCRRFGEASRRIVEQKFTMNRMARRYTDLLQSLHSPSGGEA